MMQESVENFMKSYCYYYLHSLNTSILIYCAAVALTTLENNSKIVATARLKVFV